MKRWLSSTFLSIPIVVWVLQLVYIAVSLSILYVIYPKINKKIFIVYYVLAMIIIDVIWRLAIRNIF
jgi:hypothetical protein